MLTRRSLLASTAALAVCASAYWTPSNAWIHGRSVFNGGRSQTNSLGLGNDGIYPFLDFMKQSRGFVYRATPTDPLAPRVPVAEVDINGYPTTIVAGTTGYQTIFNCQSLAEYSGIFVVTWDGAAGNTLALNGGFGAAPGYGSPSSFTGNRYEFIRTQDDATAGVAAVNVLSMTADYVRNIRIFRKVDEAALSAGQFLGVQFATRMREANPGYFRSLGWIGSGFDGTNVCNMALWAHRKPITHYSYNANELRASAYAGRTTNSGNDYSVTFIGYAATDKALSHVLFNATAITVNTSSAVVTAGTPGTIAIAGTNLQVGNAIAVAGAPPSGLTAGSFYYVQSITATDTYTLATTRGGAAIVIAGSSSSVAACTVPMLNINGTGWYPLSGGGYAAIGTSAFVGFSTQMPIANSINTVILDLSIGYYVTSTSSALTAGSNRGTGDNPGIASGAPPEIFLQTCITLGMHPWIVQPFLTTEVAANVHAITDWMPSFAALIKASNPGWIKPLFEPPNETWNGVAGFLATQYSKSVSWARWAYTNASGNANVHNPYGKWTSTLGQAMSALYANDRTKYSTVWAIQTVSVYSGGTQNDPRIQSTLYVSQNGGEPAYKWADRCCNANYYTPYYYYAVDDPQMAFSYCVTNAGNASAQAAIAETYALGAANAAPNTPFTLAYFQQNAANLKTYVQAQGPGNTIAGLVCYEGAYSPDYMTNALLQWSSPITSITAANPAVITLAGTFSNQLTSPISGNPFVVGMGITPSGVAGMTQANIGLQTSATMTFVGGGSAAINVTNTFSVDDAVIFSNATNVLLPLTTAFPPEIASGKPYYVVSASGSSFQVSATKGGAAITFATALSNTGNFAARCFRITAVAGNTVTIDFDASALSPGTGGNGSMAGSLGMSNTLRYASRLSTALGTVNDQMYANINSLAGAGFVVEAISNFLYFGLAIVWTVLDKTTSAATPQWNSIKTYNH